jgi:IS1 family transposase
LTKLLDKYGWIGQNERMNRLSIAERTRVVASLVEGNSIRATVRMTGVAKNTIVKLLVELGAACSKYQDEKIRNVRSQRVQCDEIWSFVGSKEKNTSIEKKAEGCGDCWTWTALDADTKLMISFRLGDRTLATAYDFMHDVAERIANRIQLTTDGHRVYLEAVESAFGLDIDYAMLNKVYRSNPEGQTRYSPAKCIDCTTQTISGSPDPKHVSTSYVERANLTMRMSMRRFTRLTNAFSKKLENHAAMVALYFMFYNFGRVHQTLRVTPAMEAGLANHVWSIEEIVGLLDRESAVSA